MAMASDSAPADPGRVADVTPRRAARIARMRAKAFGVARRHTILVKSLRILLPLGILAILGSYGAYIYVKTGLRIAGGQATVAHIEVTSEDLKMKGVSYAGQSKDGNRYQVRARDAAVDFAQTGPTRLNEIEGDLTQPNGVVTKLKSRAGLLDNKKAEMTLLDGVDIVSSNGLRATMKSAKVFNKESRIVAREGVTADMPTGRISADTMNLETKAKRGTFEGNVGVRLTQDPAAAKPMIGLGKEARAPIDVKAQRLDIDDAQRLATFTGGVTAAQGESTMRSANLRITYESPPAAAAGVPAPTDLMSDSATKVQRLTAGGGVVILAAPDRRVQADTVDFDVPGDTATFRGTTVEVQQGKNRLLGRRLIVDRKSGRSTLDAPGEGRAAAGRIQTTFYQANDGKDAARRKAATPADGGAGLMSFNTDPNAPMDVTAERLDVNDASRQAVYRGAVRAQQGDFVMETTELVATYTGDTGLMAAADGGAGKGAAAQMSKVEAKSKVHITSREGQSLRGEWAIFDVKANTVLVGGPVFVKQGPNEVVGRQLRIDMTTGEAKFDDVPGQARIGPASVATGAAKSAPGPGGLPAIGSGVAATTTSPGCPPGGRACLTFYPDTAKTLQQRGQPGAKAAVPKAAAPKPSGQPAAPAAKPDGWSATTSQTASPTYRAP